MFQLGKTLVSEALIKNEFVCNLSACKGQCCISGEAGAPLEPEEVVALQSQIEAIKPLLLPEGVEAIARHGVSVQGADGSLETPLVQGEACAYAVYDHQGHAQCGIEQAHAQGCIDFEKPISCHLYPVRVQEYSEFSAVNYHSWSICDEACSLGASLEVPVYKFVKKALLRKFGAAWYAELEQVVADLEV